MEPPPTNNLNDILEDVLVHILLQFQDPCAWSAFLGAVSLPSCRDEQDYVCSTKTINTYQGMACWCFFFFNFYYLFFFSLLTRSCCDL
jgi:hypothetical protein